MRDLLLKPLLTILNTTEKIEKFTAFAQTVDCFKEYPIPITMLLIGLIFYIVGMIIKTIYSLTIKSDTYIGTGARIVFRLQITGWLLLRCIFAIYILSILVGINHFGNYNIF